MEKIKILQAKDLAKGNQAAIDVLRQRHTALQNRSEQLPKEHQAVLDSRFSGSIEPFAASFARLKNVDVESPDLRDRMPAISGLKPAEIGVSLGAVQTAVATAGGAAAGAAAAATTYAAVGAFAAASTGTAISTLSGAAATSATLAWLGGGSLAAGGAGVAGGTMVLTGVVAAPALLATMGAVSYVGRKELAKQRQVALDITFDSARLDTDTERLDGIGIRMAHSQRALERLAELIAPRNKWLDDISWAKPDYLEFTSVEKDLLAELLALITAMDAVMRAPVIATDAAKLDEHLRVVQAADMTAVSLTHRLATNVGGGDHR